MELRIRSTGQVLTEEQFRRAHTNTNIPTPITLEVIDALGADVVLEGPQPAANMYQVVYRDGVEFIGKHWHKKYSVRDMHAYERAKVDAEIQKANEVTTDA